MLRERGEPAVTLLEDENFLLENLNFKLHWDKEEHKKELKNKAKLFLDVYNTGNSYSRESMSLTRESLEPVVRLFKGYLLSDERPYFITSYLDAEANNQFGRKHCCDLISRFVIQN